MWPSFYGNHLLKSKGLWLSGGRFTENSHPASYNHLNQQVFIALFTNWDEVFEVTV